MEVDGEDDELFAFGDDTSRSFGEPVYEICFRDGSTECFVASEEVYLFGIP